MQVTADQARCFTVKIPLSEEDLIMSLRQEHFVVGELLFTVDKQTSCRYPVSFKQVVFWGWETRWLVSDL